MKFHETTFHIDWPEVIKGLANLSIEKQYLFHRRTGDPSTSFMAEISAVRFGGGRQSGMTKAALEAAKRNNWLFIADMRSTESIVRSNPDYYPRLGDIATLDFTQALNIGIPVGAFIRMPRPDELVKAPQGIIIDASNLIKYSGLQFHYAIVNALNTVFLGKDFRNFPIVILG
jgi:hypothetical protein